MTKVAKDELGSEGLDATLDTLAREGARRMIMVALEAEVDAYLARFRGVQGEDGRASFLSSGGAVVKVSWPFLSNKWTATSRVYDPAGSYRAIRLDAKRIVIMTSDPGGFISDTSDPCWTMLAGTRDIKLPSESCKASTTGVTGLSDFAVDITLADAVPDKVVLVSPEKFPYAVDVPKVSAAAEPAWA